MNPQYLPAATNLPGEMQAVDSNFAILIAAAAVGSLETSQMQAGPDQAVEFLTIGLTLVGLSELRH